jgi:tRNA C32,U32 (ribose-2'-O)-methylase TrmJ
MVNCPTISSIEESRSSVAHIFAQTESCSSMYPPMSQSTYCHSSSPRVEYLPLNISHAVAVVLYELCDIEIGGVLLVDRRDLDLLYEHIETVLCDLGYPEHKRQKTVLMTRRILGRAELTAREVYTLRGILRLIDYHKR